MSGPVEVGSVTEWNTALREAKAAGRAVVADFHAEWCGPCKQIAPYYAKLATENPGATWLRVDVDGQGTRLIAQKYKITAMPTFVVISNGEVAETLRGADPRGLTALAKKYGEVKLDPDAEREKAAGNKVRGKGKSAGGRNAETLGEKAFTAGDYALAVEHYSEAIRRERKSAVLYGNRSIAYLKLAAQKEPQGSTVGGENYRSRALNDAIMATELDERWPKGWVRLAEAILASGDDNGAVAPENRAEGKVKTLEGAEAALVNAVGLAPEGRVKAEAQKMLDDIRHRLQELKPQ